MKLSIIIPVYNEVNTLQQIIQKVDSVAIQGCEKEIVIVDDCSTDGSGELLRSGKYDKAKILYHEKNMGKGSAIRTGLAAVTGDYVVIQDADLEYDPNDLNRMLEEMVKNDLPVLFGSRRLNKNNIQYSGMLYYFGGWILTIITNILYAQNLTDEPTCYKMFKTDLLKSMPLRCERFEFCPEVTALTALKKIKIKEIPIAYHPRHKKEGKKIKWFDEIEAIKVLIKYRLGL